MDYEIKEKNVSYILLDLGFDLNAWVFALDVLHFLLKLNIN
jgi:hypothetical protein